MASSTMSTTPPKMLGPLRPIGKDLYLYEPSESDQHLGPRLIIIFTWLGGATSRRIEKYVAGYRSIWPNAAILLVTTRMAEFVAQPSSALHARLAPAHDVIHRLSEKTPAKDGGAVLLHIFSNGGLYTAVHLILSLQQPPQSREPLDLGRRIGGIILDCCPGQTEFQRTYTAAKIALPPSAAAQILGKAFFFILVGLFAGLTHSGLMSGVKHLRRQLNDPAVFGTARRLYLYSKTDQIVGWEDVESHINEAKDRRKYEVEALAFSDGQHCALVRENEERYWTAIQRFWTQTGPPIEIARSRL